MTLDRRETLRVPENRLVTEIVTERPSAASVVNLSATGIYTVKPLQSGIHGQRLVQLEIPIPEANDSVWASGEIMFEARGNNCIGTGIRFIDMARYHHQLLRDVVETKRREILAAMLREIRWRKELGAHPSPFSASPPQVNENTVRMYLLPRA